MKHWDKQNTINFLRILAVKDEKKKGKKIYANKNLHIDHFLIFMLLKLYVIHFFFM